MGGPVLYSFIRLLQGDDKRTLTDLYNLNLRPYIERGQAFSASGRASIDAAESLGFYFENPSGSGKNVFMIIITVRGTAKGDLDIYDKVSVTTPGTQINPRNLNLGSTNTSVCYIEYGGTYNISSAIPVKVDVLPGGSKIRAVGDAAEVGESIMLPPGTSVLVVITNTSTDTARYAVSFLWIEV